jgi:mono/diheme cytochrome c family protein
LRKEKLYEIYCISCHGGAGNGKGKLVEKRKFLGVPSYRIELSLEEYLLLTYGLNSMGSHANQFSRTLVR